MPKPQILVLSEEEKMSFKKDIQAVFRKYGLDNGFWVSADNNPIAKELSAIESVITEKTGSDPV